MIKYALFICVIVTGILGYVGFRAVYVGQMGSDEPVIVRVEKGQGVASVVADLESKQLLDSKLLFTVYLTKSGLDTKIKPGTYEVNSAMSMKTLAEVLISGVSYNERTITFLEGWNLRDIAQYLMREDFIMDEEDLYAVTGYPAQVFHGVNDELLAQYPFLQDVPSGYSLEGFIFPDTYRVYADASVEDIIKKALDNFQTKYTTRIESELFKTPLSFYDALKLASVVVKEARLPDDKKKVAGVFLNRMNIRMALQSDPTVNYVTLKVTDNPSLEDIAMESEYNTYKYAGLPPTPIANPGIEDILAVLDPAQHSYFFFLNTKQGEMIFSKDFDEHRANRIKYGQ